MTHIASQPGRAKRQYKNTGKSIYMTCMSHYFFPLKKDLLFGTCIIYFETIKCQKSTFLEILIGRHFQGGNRNQNCFGRTKCDECHSISGTSQRSTEHDVLCEWCVWRRLSLCKACFYFFLILGLGIIYFIPQRLNLLVVLDYFDRILNVRALCRRRQVKVNENPDHTGWKSSSLDWQPWVTEMEDSFAQIIDAVWPLPVGENELTHSELDRALGD